LRTEAAYLESVVILAVDHIPRWLLEEAETSAAQQRLQPEAAV